ncbi:MAG: hypothetical protein QM594_05910 [Niabella sp.]
MAKYEFSPLEKEMLSINLSTAEADYNDAVEASTQREFLDASEKICAVWRKARPYVRLAEAIPVAGRFIKLLADVLDTICPANP